MKKRILSILLATLFVVPMAACRKSKPSDDTSSAQYEWVYEDVTVSGENPGSEQGSQNGQTTSGSKGQSGSSGKGTANKVTTADGHTLSVNKGTKPIEEGLNFGGKTFLFAGSGSNDPKTLRALKAFEKKFNCKFTVVTPGATDYIAKAAAQMSTGHSYDIGWIDGSQFPKTVMANLWEPLENAFTSADLYDPSKPNAGGIRADKSSQGFYWNGHVYGVCGKKYTGLKVLAYNKLRFEEEDLEDPMELYNKGQWTWDKLIEFGRKVYVKDKYYLGGSEFRSNWVQANGGHWVINDNGKIRENFSDKKIFNALKWTQDLVFGADSIINPDQTSDITKRMNNFVSGANYMMMIGDYGYRAQLSPLVAESSNFGSSKEERRKNLGMVPLPLGPDNTEKEYPSEFYSGVTCGKGSDPRLAIAWAKFLGSYKDTVKDEYTFTAEEQKLIDKLLDGKTNVCNYNYSNSSDSISSIMTAVIIATTTGGKDVAATLESQKAKAQTVIDSCIGQ